VGLKRRWAGFKNVQAEPSTFSAADAELQPGLELLGSATNYLWTLPKTLKVSGNDSYSTTDNFFVTYTGTLSFDKLDTWYANFSPPISFADVVATGVSHLINNGYIQDP